MEFFLEDGFMFMWIEKRVIFNMDYNESNVKCLFLGCDFKGKWLRKSLLFMLLEISELYGGVD